MKLIVNTDEHCTETVVSVNCQYISDDIEKLLALIKMLDMKISGRKDGRDYFLDIADIVYIENTDRRNFLYTLTDTYEIQSKLYELETKLIAMDFIRANRNCLVNINHIKSIETELNSRLILTMPKDIKLIVSRQYASEVKQKLEGYHV